MTSFPPNFIPIVDAFNQAVAELAPEIAGPAKDPSAYSKTELEIPVEIAGREKGLNDPSKFEIEFDESAQQVDEAERKVERLFRDALADGSVDAWVKNPATGLMEELIDAVSGREAWRQMASGMPGFELRTHHLTNPGPNEERPAFVERGRFEAWIGIAAKQLGIEARQEAQVAEISRFRRGRPEVVDSEAVRIALYQECDRQLGVPSLETDKGWRTPADANKFVLDWLSLKGETASQSTVRRHVRKMLNDYPPRGHN
jgi:hypothetical protein